MPTPIKPYNHQTKVESQRDTMRSSIREILRSIRSTLRNKHAASYTGLVSLTWGEDELGRVDAMREFLGPQAINATPAVIVADVTLDHPILPQSVERAFEFRVDNPKSRIARPFPKEWFYSDGYRLPHGVMGETFTAVINEALDYICIRDTLRTLTETCETYEQLLYLFPHFRTVLKKSALPVKYENIEVNRSPAKLPRLTERTRRMMKHAHTLMAMHTLLDTFNNPQLTSVPGDGETCVVTLAGNTEVQVDNGAGVMWGYDIGFCD